MTPSTLLMLRPWLEREQFRHFLDLACDQMDVVHRGCDKRKHIWVKSEQIKSLLAAAKKHSPGFLYPILLLVHETAAKTSDIIELKWQDVDLKGQKIVLREGEKIQLRVLPISDELTTTFKSLDQLGEHVFTNLEGRPLYKQCLVRELRILKRQLGIEQDWVFR
ncbi:MAG: tyrosine-type recombinase/integrase, partial [Bdellovibrionota bacterium]